MRSTGFPSVHGFIGNQIRELKMSLYERIKKNNPELIIKEDVHEISGDPVTQSGDRSGYFVIAGNDKDQIRKYLPD